MTEEELQELKEWHENDGGLHQFQIDKLIEIAERFNNIQKENARLSILLRETQIELMDSQQRNKNYHEALKNISVLREIIEWADEALKSETNVKNYKDLTTEEQVEFSKMLRTWFD